MNITIGRNKAGRQKPKEIVSAGEFYQELKALTHNNALVKVYSLSGQTQEHKGGFPVEIITDTNREIEDVIFAEYGNGIFQLILQDEKRIEKARFTLNINRGKTSKTDAEAKGQFSNYPNLGASLNSLKPFIGPIAEKLFSILEKAIDSKGSHSDLIEGMKLGREMAGSKDEIFNMLLQNALQPQGDPLETLQRSQEIIKSLGPQVEPSDGITQILTTVAGLVGMGAMRGNQALPYAAQQPMMPLASAPGANLRSEPVKQHLNESEGVHIQAVQAPVPALSKDDIFYKAFIEPFMEHIEQAETAENLAIEIHQMLQYTIIQMKDQPHPLIEGFLTDNPLELNAAFNHFSNTIPNLKNKPALQAQIRAELIKMFSQIQSVNEAINADEEEIEIEEENESNSHEDGQSGQS